MGVTWEQTIRDLGSSRCLFSSFLGRTIGWQAAAGRAQGEVKHFRIELGWDFNAWKSGNWSPGSG